MADKSESPGFLRTILTTLAGLASGAVLMYLSPLVNNALKPPRPFPNFAFQVEGLKVTFVNRTTSAHDGWWDFGDNSALEPFVPDRERHVHQFPKPGSYSVKLLLKNILGEEAERTVSVVLDDKTMPVPQIGKFLVQPLSQYSQAPATFQVYAEVSNADLCIWSLGDEKPMEIVADPGTLQKKMITFNEPGFKTIRLVLANGKNTAEKTETVFVAASDFTPSSSVPSASVALNLTYGAVPTGESKSEIWSYEVPLLSSAGSTVPFDTAPKTAMPGYAIVKSEMLPNKSIKDAKPIVSPDQATLRLHGEAIKPNFGFGKTSPKSITALVRVTLEKRAVPGDQLKEFPRDPVFMSLKVPGETVLPLPSLESGWQAKWLKLDLKIRDERSQIVYSGQNELPQNATVNIGGKTMKITGTRGIDYLKFIVQPSVQTFPLSGS